MQTDFLRTPRVSQFVRDEAPGQIFIVGGASVSREEEAEDRWAFSFFKSHALIFTFYLSEVPNYILSPKHGIIIAELSRCSPITWSSSRWLPTARTTSWRKWFLVFFYFFSCPFLAPTSANIRYFSTMVPFFFTLTITITTWRIWAFILVIICVPVSNLTTRRMTGRNAIVMKGESEKKGSSRKCETWFSLVSSCRRDVVFFWKGERND